MKKGFTLVELMAVIIILAIISLIVFPAMVKTIDKSKQDLYDKQVKTLEKAAKDWSIQNTDKLPDEVDGDDCYLPLGDLITNGLIETGDIKDPKTGDDMEGSILITYSDTVSQYVITYDTSSQPADSRCQ